MIGFMFEMSCSVTEALDEAQNGLKIREIEHAVNLRQSQIEKVLKLLVVEPLSPVLRLDSTWFRTPNPYQLDQERIDHLTRQREAEWSEMKTYLESKCCLMQFLAKSLDDESGFACGQCAVCLGHAVVSTTILLVDDVVDSAWTLTIASALLLQTGTSIVYPFALATTSSK